MPEKPNLNFITLAVRGESGKALFKCHLKLFYFLTKKES